jgi:hypothetical protein
VELVQELVGLILEPRAQRARLLARDHVKVQHELIDQIRQRYEVVRVELLQTGLLLTKKKKSKLILVIENLIKKF